MKLIKRLFPNEAAKLGFVVKKNDPLRSKARYSVSEEQWEAIQIKRITPNKRKFVKTIEKFDKNGLTVSTVEKLQSKPIDIPENFELIKVSTSKTTGQQWTQYAAKTVTEEVKDFDFEAIIKSTFIQLNKQLHQYLKAKRILIA